MSNTLYFRVFGNLRLQKRDYDLIISHSMATVQQAKLVQGSRWLLAAVRRQPVCKVPYQKRQDLLEMLHAIVRSFSANWLLRYANWLGSHSHSLAKSSWSRHVQRRLLRESSAQLLVQMTSAVQVSWLRSCDLNQTLLFHLNPFYFFIQKILNNGRAVVMHQP